MFCVKEAYRFQGRLQNVFNKPLTYVYFNYYKYNFRICKKLQTNCKLSGGTKKITSIFEAQN